MGIFSKISIGAAKNFVTARPVFSSMVAGLAVVGVGADMVRRGQEAEMHQGLEMAGQQLQAERAHAINALEQAQMGAHAHHHASPQIMGGSAQHMGLMDAAPEVARG